MAVAIGATLGLSGGEKKPAAAAPAPVAEDTSIKADSKDELDLWVCDLSHTEGRTDQ